MFPNKLSLITLLVLATISALLVASLLTLWFNTRVPPIDSEQDTKDFYKLVEEERNQRSLELGKEAFDRLNQKYGDGGTYELP